MNEHSFSSKIIKKCREKGIAKAWKINDDFQGGVPDAWFLGKENDIWIEFKWLKELPKRETTLVRPKLSAQQLDWLLTLRDHGKMAYCILGLPKQAFVFKSSHEWAEGVMSYTLGKQLISHNDLVEWIVKKCGV